MEPWTTGSALPRGSARTAKQLEDAGWGSFPGRRFAEPVGRSLRRARDGRHRDVAAWSCHRRNEHGHAACFGHRVLHRERAKMNIQRARVSGIGRGDFGAGTSGCRRVVRTLFAAFAPGTACGGRSVPHPQVDRRAAHVGNWNWPMSSTARTAWPSQVAASGLSGYRDRSLARRPDHVRVGADAARLARGIALAKETRAKAGLDPDCVAFGAHEALTRPAARRHRDGAYPWCAGSLTTFARFNVMHGMGGGSSVSEGRWAALWCICTKVTTCAHTRAAILVRPGCSTESFIDRFAIRAAVTHPSGCMNSPRLDRIKSCDRRDARSVGE